MEGAPIMPIRYMVSHGSDYYPSGGADDLLSVHATEEEALQAARISTVSISGGTSTTVGPGKSFTESGVACDFLCVEEPSWRVNFRTGGQWGRRWQMLSASNGQRLSVRWMPGIFRGGCWAVGNRWFC